MSNLSKTNIKSLIVIDSRVTDWQRLISEVNQNATLLVLDPARDGLTQIAEAVANSSNINAIHIISHGNTGSLLLGSTILDSNNLGDYLTQLTTIGNALTETGDLLLYGCNVAQGDVGQAFIQQLATVTGVDVAASNNLTGSSDLNADWNLESVIGQIEATGLNLEYSDTLSSPIIKTYWINDGVSSYVVDYDGTVDNFKVYNALDSESIPKGDWVELSISAELNSRLFAATRSLEQLQNTISNEPATTQNAIDAALNLNKWEGASLIVDKAAGLFGQYLGGVILGAGNPAGGLLTLTSEDLIQLSLDLGKTALQQFILFEGVGLSEQAVQKYTELDNILSATTGSSLSLAVDVATIEQAWSIRNDASMLSQLGSKFMFDVALKESLNESVWDTLLGWGETLLKGVVDTFIVTNTPIPLELSAIQANIVTFTNDIVSWLELGNTVLDTITLKQKADSYNIKYVDMGSINFDRFTADFATASIFPINANIVPTPGNSAPVVTGAATIQLQPSQTIVGSDLFTSISDANGESDIALIKFWDSTLGAGYIALDGIKQSVITVTPSDLGRVTYIAGTEVGTNQIIVEAFDQTGADSNDLRVTLVVGDPSTLPPTLGQHAPVVSGSASVSVAVNQSLQWWQLFNQPIDLDGNNTIDYVIIWDSTPGSGVVRKDSFSTSKAIVPIEELWKIRYDAGHQAGTNLIVIEAVDKQGNHSIDHYVAIKVVDDRQPANPNNHAPVVSGNPVVDIAVGETILGNGLFTTVTDADGVGDIAFVVFWDSTLGSDGGYLTLDGQRVTKAEVPFAELSRIAYVAGNQTGLNDIVVEAFDKQGLDSNDQRVTLRVGGAAAANLIMGTAGNDTLTGTDGNDIILGFEGNDIINAGDGNDTISVLANDWEADVVSGDTGTDSLSIDFSTTYYFDWGGGGLYWRGYDASETSSSWLSVDSNISTIQTVLNNAVKLNVAAAGNNYGVIFDGIENLSLTATTGDGYYGIYIYDDLLIVQGNGNYDGKGGTDAIYADWSSATSAITISNIDPTTAQAFNGSTITNIERWLVLTGSGDDVITAYSDNDEIDSGAGNDTINAGAGSDMVRAGSGNDTIALSANNHEADVVSGGTGTDSLSIDFSASMTGYYGILFWKAYDALGNATSSSFMYYGSNIAAIQTALSNAIKLNVAVGPNSGVTFDGIENLNLTTSDAGYDDLLILQGNGSYDGKSGTDAIYADWSSATSAITISNTDPTTAQDFNGSTITNIERWLVQTGSGDDVITAYSDNDEIDSGAGNDTINAGAGSDRIWGGIGVDTAIFSGMYSDYQIDTIIDGIKVTDLRYGGDGVDELYDIEFLQFSDKIVGFGNTAPVLTTPAVINYTDTVFDDSFATIIGSLVATDADNNILSYGITGGTDNELTVSKSGLYGVLTVTKADGTYHFVANDAAIEALTVAASDSFAVTVSDGSLSDSKTLVINIAQAGITESNGNDSLTGTAANNQFNGLAGNDIISGLAGDDTIDGGAGADRMIGGIGNDTYYLDNVGDVVKENTREGLDTVYSSVSHILAANVENLILTNTSISGTGNALDNYLTGNIADNSLSGESGNDTIDGQGGADTMVGGKGDDSYYVDNVGDVVKESAREGVDTVYSSVNYSLTPNVENLVLIGTAVEGTGNESDNYLKGNDASNTLRGGLGSDNYDLSEITAVTDTVRIATGESLIANYDKVSNFTLGAVSNISDELDLDFTLIAVNVDSVDGNNSGNIKSHCISNGIISFDDVNFYANPLILTDANLAKVFSYLQANITEQNTVAFVAEGNTFVFQDGGDAADTLVELVGVTASSINTTDLGSVWIM